MIAVRDSILKGVNTVPKCGYPGSLITFDHNATPILTGDNENSVIFAAANYGKGRIFVTSHESYIYHFINGSKDFVQLWRNIKNWLMNSTNLKEQYWDKNIPDIENYELVSDIPEDVKLLKWIGTQNKTDIFINQLLKKYVMEGGSVICGICPWGWLSISHGRSLEEMSLNKFTSSCGISFSADICLNKSNAFNVENNLASQSHFSLAINSLNEDITTLVKNESLILNGIESLPNKFAVKFFEHLNAIFLPHVASKYKPSYEHPVNTEIGISLLSIASKVMQKQAQCGLIVKALNINEFPGDFHSHPEKTTGIVFVKSRFNEFHCTGYYIEAGNSVRVQVLEGSTTGWEIRISSHTDDLSTMKTLKRWPLISSKVKLKKEMVLTSAFGGIIYLDSPNGTSKLKIQLENVVKTPFLDLNSPDTISNWKNSRQYPGLWAEVCGKHITFTVPSSSVRRLAENELINSLKLWDLMIIANHELRGTNVNNCCRERVVVDVQPFNDRIHSGYPIVLPYGYIDPSANIYIFNDKKVAVNGWNLVHEIGHNMTRGCWTPTGTEEVTVNIFTLHAFHLVLQQKPLTETILKEKLTDSVLNKYASSDFSFEKWKRYPYIGLLIYMQMINSFGWNAFKIIFREYESLPEKEKLLTNDSTKWNEWIIRFSNIVGLDVSPLFYFWNIPFSEKISSNLNDLTPWLPNDEITRLFPERTNYVKKNYNGLLFGNEALFSSCPKIMYPDDFIFDSIEKLESLSPMKISYF